MHPLSIVIAFGFLGMLTVIGAQLSILSSRWLWKQVTPALSFQQSRNISKASVSGLLLALGLFLLVLGVQGIYRLIWAV